MGPSQNRPVKIPYTTVRNGHRFFEPRGRMREHGFRSVPLGLDSEATRRAAWALYERWLAIRDGHEALPDTSKPHSKIEIASRKIYPPGSYRPRLAEIDPHRRMETARSGEPK